MFWLIRAFRSHREAAALRRFKRTMSKYRSKLKFSGCDE